MSWRWWSWSRSTSLTPAAYMVARGARCLLVVVASSKRRTSAGLKISGSRYGCFGPGIVKAASGLGVNEGLKAHDRHSAGGDSRT